MTGRFEQRFQHRDWFRPGEMEQLSSNLGLPMAIEQPRHAASILNAVIMHYRSYIGSVHSVEVQQRIAADTARWRRIEAAVRSLAHVLPAEGGGYLTRDQVKAEEVFARAKVASGRIRWGSAFAPSQPIRDLIGGALPKAFQVIFGQPSKLRGARMRHARAMEKFIAIVCRSIGLPVPNAVAIKQSGKRFRADRSACLPEFLREEKGNPE